MSVEIVNEPPPPARASGKGNCDVNVRLIDSKSNEVVKTVNTQLKENERREREERKY